jgi:probable rRNA maturation factor
MIVNQQRRVRVSISGLEKFLAAARKRLRLGPRSLTIALVTDAQIRRWNRAYRGKNRPTDVLSFPADGPVPQTTVQSSRVKQSRQKSNRAPSAKSGKAQASAFASFTSSTSSAFSTSKRPYLGDIAIAPAVARRNASRLGRAFDHEMRILILHGILHLLGYDHETDTGEMDRRENRLRRDLGLL